MISYLMILFFPCIREYLEKDVNPPKDKIHVVVDAAADHVTCAIKELRRLFLIEDLVDTLKVSPFTDGF
jgi:signal transduction histidine kinase